MISVRKHTMIPPTSPFWKRNFKLRLLFMRKSAHCNCCTQLNKTLFQLVSLKGHQPEKWTKFKDAIVNLYVAISVYWPRLKFLLLVLMKKKCNLVKNRSNIKKLLRMNKYKKRYKFSKAFILAEFRVPSSITTVFKGIIFFSFPYSNI